MACCGGCAGAFKAVVSWATLPATASQALTLQMPPEYVGLSILKWRIRQHIVDTTVYRPGAVGIAELPIQSCIVDMRPAIPVIDTRGFALSGWERVTTDGSDESPWFDAGGMTCPNKLTAYSTNDLNINGGTYPPSNAVTTNIYVLEFEFAQKKVNKM